MSPLIMGKYHLKSEDVNLESFDIDLKLAIANELAELNINSVKNWKQKKEANRLKRLEMDLKYIDGDKPSPDLSDQA